MKHLFVRISLAAMMVMALCVSALAADGDAVTADSVITSVVSGLTTAQGNILTAISKVVPVALVVFGVVMAVRVGLRMFKVAGGSGR